MKLKLLIIFVLGVFANLISFAQNKDLSKQINEANSLVYNNPDKAILQANILLKNIKKEDISNRINIYLVLGGAFSTKEKHYEALNFGFEAYDLVKNTNYNTEQIKALGFIANQYYILQMDDKVGYYLDNSEKIIAQKPLNDSLNYLAANIYILQAIRYKDKLDCDFAINYFDKSLKAYKSANYKNSKFNLPIIYIQKAYCFYDLNQLELAKKNFEDAYNIAIKSDNEYAKSYALIGLAMVLTKNGQYQQSNDSLEKVKNNFNSQTSLGLQLETYSALTENYYKLENQNAYLKSADLLKKTIHLNDSVNTSSIEKILEDQHQNMNEIYEKSVFNRICAIAFGVTFILLMVFLIFFRQKK